MKRVSCIFFLSTILQVQNIEAQFNCPDSLIYGVTPLFSPFIRVTNPKLPLSASNPSNTAIPNPAPGVGAGLSLSKNLNGGLLSPTLYSSLANGNFCYWNGSNWVDTGHFSTDPNNNGQISIGGCDKFIFSVWISDLLGHELKIYRYDGTGAALLLFTVQSTEAKFVNDVVTDCHCNFYLLSNNVLRKYSSSGILQTTLAVNGIVPSNTAGNALAMIGNTLYATSIPNGMNVGVITSTGVTFVQPSSVNWNYGASDLASCPSSSIVSTAATINSGSIGCNPSSINLSVNATLSPLSYHWSGPGIGNSVPGPSLQNVSQAGTYTVAITQTGCDYVLATVVSTVVSNVTTVNPQIYPAAQVCIADVSQLYSSINAATYNYQWTGTAISGGANTPSISFAAAGIYSVTVTDPDNGCFGTATASVLESPLLSMGISSPTLCVSS